MRSRFFYCIYSLIDLTKSGLTFFLSDCSSLPNVAVINNHLNGRQFSHVLTAHTGTSKRNSSFPNFFFPAAFFNVTSNLVRSSQAFNLTISDSCTANYTVHFGDLTSAVTLSQAQKIVSHSYATAGTYNITVQFSGGVPPAEGCKTAQQSMDVRDPIVNMVSSISAPVI